MPSTSARPSRSTRAKPAAPVNAGALVTKARVFTPDAKLVAEFRDEAKSMMQRLPPLRPESKLDRATAEVHVLTTVERRTGTLQESLQFCSAVDAHGNEESWIERTEGERRLFPRVLQVKKRLRNVDDEYAIADAAAAAAAAAEDDDIDEQVTPRKVSKKAAAGTASSSSPSSARKASSSAKKHRRASHAHADDDHAHEHERDDGAQPETDAEALRRARHEKRRSSARLSSARRSESESAGVKREHDVDDLASLCGRVDGLEFRATVEPGASLFSLFLLRVELRDVHGPRALTLRPSLSQTSRMLSPSRRRRARATRASSSASTVALDPPRPAPSSPFTRPPLVLFVHLPLSSSRRDVHVVLSCVGPASLHVSIILCGRRARARSRAAREQGGPLELARRLGRELRESKADLSSWREDCASVRRARGSLQHRVQMRGVGGKGSMHAKRGGRESEGI